MVSGLPDNTIAVWIEKALGYDAKFPMWEIEPWTGRYFATPDDWKDGDYGSILTDIKGRAIINIHDIESGVSVDADITDDWTRQLGQVDLARVLGSALAHANPVIARITDGTAYIAPALQSQLPSALDSGALKVKEQSPITDFPDSAVATLLAGGLPSALDIDALKVREQNPITDFPDSTAQATLSNIETLLGEPADRNITQIAGTALTGRDWSLDLKALIDDSIKGLFRSLGDSGANTENTTGASVLWYLNRIEDSLGKIDDWDNSDMCDVVLNKIGTTALTARDWSGDFKALIDDSVKGLMRSIGDASTTPTNTTGETILKKLDRIATALEIVDDWDASNRCKVYNSEAYKKIVAGESCNMWGNTITTGDTEYTGAYSGAGVIPIILWRTDNPTGNQYMYASVDGGDYDVVLQNPSSLYSGYRIPVATSIGCNRFIYFERYAAAGETVMIVHPYIRFTSSIQFAVKNDAGADRTYYLYAYILETYN